MTKTTEDMNKAAIDTVYAWAKKKGYDPIKKPDNVSYMVQETYLKLAIKDGKLMLQSSGPHSDEVKQEVNEVLGAGQEDFEDEPIDLSGKEVVPEEAPRPVKKQTPKPVPKAKETDIERKVRAEVEKIASEFPDLGVLYTSDGNTITVSTNGQDPLTVNATSGAMVQTADTPIATRIRDAIFGPVPAVIPSAIPDKPVEQLTIADVKAFFCPAASDTDAYIFLNVCKTKKLDPFMREVYLIAFENKKTGEMETSIVVGKDAFVRKAEENPNFGGFKAGLIIEDNDGVLHFDREGEFVASGEKLLGGWAEVYRTGVNEPFKASVSLGEYKRPNRQWEQRPATMIRKVALVHALREAFAESLGGLYDQAEMKGA
ncbi:MAG: phage recombination protein Bet [Patescibacteria group bacterium]